MDELFYKIFEAMERQGPGDDKSTDKAYSFLTLLPGKADILDIGCGSGSQTMVLARLNEGKITALDNHSTFLEILNKKIIENNLEDRIETITGDMNSLPFNENSFDLIWSEGSVFIMGFENALIAWKKFLKDKGYLVISELTWFKKEVPDEINKFFLNVYPQIKYYDDLNGIIESSGYKFINSFPLPAQSWWTDYYYSAEKAMNPLRKKYFGDDSAAVFNMMDVEIEMFRKYSEFYGYTFFIMQT